MKSSLAIMSACVAGLTLAGCGETRVQQLLGSGKDTAPDESQVRINQSLAMPPDLQLRAPSGQVTEYGQANKVAKLPPPQQQPEQPYEQASAAPEPMQQSQTNTAAAQEPPKQDVYERYGISKVNADGKPKTDRELIRDLREAQLAEKRRKNPNYGTVWNLGNVFSNE